MLILCEYQPVPPSLSAQATLAGIHFRPAVPADAGALYAACHARQNQPQFQTRFRHSLHEQSHGRRLHLLAVGKPGIIGSGKLIRLPGKVEIADLVVTPLWRGRGVGTAMMHILIAEAARWGYGLVEIGAEISNHRALSLYRRLGFGEEREIILPGKEPTLRLSLEIGP